MLKKLIGLIGTDYVWAKTKMDEKIKLEKKRWSNQFCKCECVIRENQVKWEWTCLAYKCDDLIWSRKKKEKKLHWFRSFLKV